MPNLGEWEKLTVIRNDDGTYSFQNYLGKYLKSVSGTGNAEVANSIGSWEKWNIYPVVKGGYCIRSNYHLNFLSMDSTYDNMKPFCDTWE